MPNWKDWKRKLEATRENKNTLYLSIDHKGKVICFKSKSSLILFLYKIRKCASVYKISEI